MKKQKIRLPDGYYCKQVCGWYVIYTWRNEFTGIRGVSRYDAIKNFFDKQKSESL